MDLSDLITPIPGATRVETVRSIARSRLIRLTDEDREQLDRRLPAARAIRHPTPAAVRHPRRPRCRPARSRSSWACRRRQEHVRREPGRQRLPAPESRRGGRLAQAITAGARCGNQLGCHAGGARQHLRFTEVAGAGDPGGGRPRIAGSLHRGSRPASRTRKPTLRGGSCRATAGCPTSRSSRRFATNDVAAFLPRCQFRYQRQLEPPELSEGFSRVDVVPFERRLDPSFVNRAVIVCCEDVLLRSRSGLRVPLAPDDVEVVTDRAAVLRRYREEGYRLLGISWQPEIADGKQSPTALPPSCARMCDLLGVDIEVEYCPHAAGPPACWCRKPLPGLGVAVRAAASPGSVAVHLRRFRSAGSRLRAAARVQVPRGE